MPHKQKIVAALLPLCLSPAWSQAADDGHLDRIEVVADTPASQEGVAIDAIPAHVQTVDAQQLDKAQSTSLAEYMNRYLGGVVVNDAQSNPLQPDVQFRGFTASPVLGLPQGLAVYVNGVRFNETFGDTVNWDLVPEGAVENMALHSGSNAVYGLNAIGGAISMRTKTGFSFAEHGKSAGSESRREAELLRLPEFAREAPEGGRAGIARHEIEVSGGSWGRHTEELRSGANDGTFGYFVDIKNFQENGWRDFSPSDAKQGFGTLSWRGEQSALNLNLAATDNVLVGNGAVPIQLLKQDGNAIFTHPDQTVNRMFLASLDGDTWLTDKVQLSGTAYFRQNRTRTFNGDGSPYGECADPLLAGNLCDNGGDGRQVLDVNGNTVEADHAVEGATANSTQINQRGVGGTLQAAFNQDLFDLSNRLVIGGSHDQGRTHYSADTELGALNDTRGVDLSGVLVGEPRVRLHSKVLHNGFFVTDTLNVTDKLALTAAGRYNLSFVKLSDRYGEDLNGFHKYQRFNPSGGLTYAFTPEATFYGGYSEATRVPTPVELSCADPAKPCRLPNAFLSDPRLNQVVAKTVEAGFRGDLDRWAGDGNRLHWNAGFFHTVNHDDIVFLSSGSLVNNNGYFRNVGETRRQGYELGLKGEFFERWRFNANYTFLDATYQTAFLATSPNNPKADADGNIQVNKGDRIPSLPRHSLKLGTDVDVLHDVTFGADMQLSTSRVFRGDEANLNGTLGGFAVFNLRGEYRVHKNVTLFGRLDNVFDRQYKSFGMYGNPGEVLGPNYDDNRFVGVGAPRAGWVGVKFSL